MPKIKIPGWMKSWAEWRSLMWNLVAQYLPQGVSAMLSLFEGWYLRYREFDWGVTIILAFISFGVTFWLIDRTIGFLRSSPSSARNQAALQEVASGNAQRVRASKDELLSNTISGRIVPIYEVPRDGPFVRWKTFEECDIIGPAVVCPMQVDFDTCLFVYEDNNPKSILWKVPEGKYIVGAIGLQGCKFKRCKFVGIGFSGTKEALESLRKMLGV